MEIFPQISTTFKDLLNGYLIEADGLAVIAESKIFPQLMDRFTDYSRYLESVPARMEAYDRIEQLTEGSWVIDAKLQECDSWLREIFYTTHLAACCELLAGSKLPRMQLQREKLRSFLQQNLRPYENADPALLTSMSMRLHTMDVVRTMQILRCLGLVHVPSAEIQQLGLGAGAGFKDVISMHMAPSIESFDASADTGQVDSGSFLNFSSQRVSIKDIVIIDADPQYKQNYEDWNKQQNPKVIAINQDTGKALEQVPELLRIHNMLPRNLVTAIRIDHRMIPDVKLLLSQISPSIGESADLVVSTGSGHTLDDFRGRIQKMHEFFDVLSQKGLQPVWIKLHKQGSEEQQWRSPLYGIASFTTFEILYCRLDRERLSESSGA